MEPTLNVIGRIGLFLGAVVVVGTLAVWGIVQYAFSELTAYRNDLEAGGETLDDR
jgi:hypothetical protein